MTWVMWRQHRTQAAIGAGILASFSILVLISGLKMASQWHTALATCAAAHVCGNLQSQLSLGHNLTEVIVAGVTLVGPPVLGLFWGAPLLARELESGTHQFAWIQSITRRRWLITKTGWILLAAAVWGGAVAALATWWYAPMNALNQDRFNPGPFDIQGIVPVGYALFAVALGIAAGTIIRRSLPALAVTLGVFVGLRLVIEEWVRPHYMTAVTVTDNTAHPFILSGAYWQLAQGAIGPNGQAISGQSSVTIAGIPLSALPASCQALAAGAGKGVPDKQALVHCVESAHIRSFITYQPANRFWAFQGIETGIFVLLAAALVAVTFIAVSRRDA
jgi:hypothetical protein